MFPPNMLTYNERIAANGFNFGGCIAVHFVVSEGSMIVPGFFALTGEWIAPVFLWMKPQIVWTISDV